MTKLPAFLCFAAVLLMAGRPAAACSCFEMTAQQRAAIIENAEAIFTGRIVALDTNEQPAEDFDYTTPQPVPQSPLYSKARVKVMHAYKNAAEGDRLEVYIDTLTSCGYLYQTGDVADFLLTRNDDVLVQTGLCDMPNEEAWQSLKAGIQ